MLTSIVALLLMMSVPAFAEAGKLTLANGKDVVATVDGEPIRMEEFNQAIASSHGARPGKAKAGNVNFHPILRRLINTRLIMAEAKSMGLGELPEVKNMVADHSRKTLMELLLEQQVRDVTADPGEVDQLYKESVKEWKIKSVVFEKEEDAKKIEEQITAGMAFDEAFEKAVSLGIGKGEAQGQYLKQKELRPRIAELVSNMEAEAVSPIVFLSKKNFVIFKLEGVRYPDEEDATAKQNAARLALNQKRVRTANAYYAGLKEKYVTFHAEVFDTIDYESDSSQFEKLSKDPRVVAEIQGQDPFTVGAFTKALGKTFHHGVDAAIESGRVNKKKREVLEDYLQKQVLLKEALKQGMDNTAAYKQRMTAYENSVIFGAFMEKVVAPEIKMTAPELQKYYRDNIETYSSPELVRLQSLVFEEKGDAQEAMDKLSKGTDFEWLRSRAEEQIQNIKGRKPAFEGKLLAVRSLPSGLRKAVSGADSGDFRLYESPDGLYYVFQVYDVVRSEAQPFESVREEVAEKVYGDKLKQSVENWADQLREHYPVKIFVKDLKP
jgi:hypothetical protein